MRRSRSLSWVAAFLLTGGGLVGAAVPAQAAVGCATAVPGDVNGDGHAEVAVGEPFNGEDSGAVHVFYGASDGLRVDATGTALNDQYVTQESPGVPGTSESGDDFGLSTLLVDLNSDQCADLVVGAPGENNGAGSVTVLYGSPAGVGTTGARSFTENTLFGPGSAARSEVLGSALTSGDLDGDGFTDLVAGAPGEVVQGEPAAGGVFVLWGAAGGLTTGRFGTSLVTQSGSAVPGTPEEADEFGSAVAAGDVNGDGLDDLVAGVPGEDGGRGIVQVLPGVTSGLGSEPGVSYGQGTPGVPGAAEAQDRLGASVATGDATGDGIADLAVGAPGENGNGDSRLGAGAVSFLRGSSAGLTGAGAQTWTQDSSGVEGVAEGDDQFGWSLVMAPLDGGPLADLAIGTPLDDIGSVRAAGSATVLLGSGTGLTTAEAGGLRLHQDVTGIAGTAERLDFFGLSLGASFVQTTGLANLVIGAPAEGLGGVAGAGQIHQLATNEFGPNPVGSRTLHVDTPGVQGTLGSDGFGYSLD